MSTLPRTLLPFRHPSKPTRRRQERRLAMHDPMVIAFDIPSPWPSRSRHHDHKSRGGSQERRWEIRHHHRCLKGATECDGCLGRKNWQMFPPWKPSSYSKFWTLAGRGFFWSALITIWHVEPGGADSGTVCKHKRRTRTGKYRYTKRWRWHVHHWRIQVPPLQRVRRYLLTRCEWCGGKPGWRRDPVNVSRGMNTTTRKPWWRGERGLLHWDCSTVDSFNRTCVCDDPVLSQGDYGRCGTCDRFRAWNTSPEHIARAKFVQRETSPGMRPVKWVMDKIHVEVGAERAVVTAAEDVVKGASDG